MLTSRVILQKFDGMWNPHPQRLTCVLQFQIHADFRLCFFRVFKTNNKKYKLLKSYLQYNVLLRILCKKRSAPVCSLAYLSWRHPGDLLAYADLRCRRRHKDFQILVLWNANRAYLNQNILFEWKLYVESFETNYIKIHTWKECISRHESLYWNTSEWFYCHKIMLEKHGL